ncbi:HET-D, partial [Penicillium freii]
VFRAPEKCSIHWNTSHKGANWAKIPVSTFGFVKFTNAKLLDIYRKIISFLSQSRVTSWPWCASYGKKVKGGLLEDSYCWIFENDDFRNGTLSKKASCSGSKGILERATDAQINNATAVLRDVIYMSVDNQPNLISHVRRQHDKTGERGFEDANAWEILSKIFSDTLKDPLLQSTYVIIDALDGCTKDRDLLLGLIAQKSSEYQRVKWIVSSHRSLLASDTFDETKTVEIWDLVTRRCKTTFKGHSEWVTSLSWSQDRSWLASGSEDHTVRI